MFTLATSVIVLGALAFTLMKMAPLKRPEVFFLLTPTKLTNLVIVPLDPNSNNKIATEKYIECFISQYVIARNEISPYANVLKNNWNKVVKPWSAPKVFSEFTTTTMYRNYALNNQNPNMTCSVNFPTENRDRAFVKISDDTYYVNFVWICENSGGQTPPKKFKIQIRIQSDLDKKVSGVFDNLEKLSANPLGIQVVQYTVMDNESDPLNSDIKL